MKPNKNQLHLEINTQCAIKIVPQNAAQSSITYGRQFNDDAVFASVLSRKSIDSLKENHADEIKDNHALKLLIVKLKQVFHVEK